MYIINKFSFLSNALIMLTSLFNLFYPELCIGCYKILVSDEKILCVNCRHDLPIIGSKNLKENKINANFYGIIPVKKVSSFLIFRKHGITQRLIHHLKYKNNQQIGAFLGSWFGKLLEKNQFFNGIDYIIPVPLHPKRFKKRGYNQVTLFGNELSNISGVSYLPNVLIRTTNTKTQTKRQRFERFENLKTLFRLTDEKILENKHVLLIDDVITTGATIQACCNELLKTKNITISIATMAYTELN